jgi:hypothetical protein
VLGHGFQQHPLEGIVVAVLLQQGQAGHRAIQGVIHVTTRSSARMPGHARILAKSSFPVKKTVRVPFVFFKKTVRVLLCRKRRIRPQPTCI